MELTRHTDALRRLSLPLCILKQMLHIPPPYVPPKLVWAHADLNESSVVEKPKLLEDIHDLEHTRRTGDEWFHSAASLGICVPSVLIPFETGFNALISPLHEAYSELHWSEPQPFPWDRRWMELIRKPQNRL